MPIHLFKQAMAALAAFGLSASAALASGWQAVGPSPQADGYSFYGVTEAVSGRATSIAFSPNYDGLGTAAMYLGTAGGGVWRSTNYSLANPVWTPLTDNLGLPPDVEDGAVDTGSLVVDPNHPNVIYDATGEANYSGDSRFGAGILKSTNGGTTWTLLSVPAFSRQAFSKIIVDPTDATGLTLYVAMRYAAGSPYADWGVYKSTDGGVNWAEVSVSIDHNLIFTDLEYTVSASNKLTVYAALGDIFGNALNGVYQSTDGGAHWTQLGGGIPSGLAVGRISLAADHTPGAAPRVYAAVSYSFDAASNGQGGQAMGVYGTGDNGATWSNSYPGNYSGSQGWYDFPIGLAPNGAVYVAGVSAPFNNEQGMLESVDHGLTWSPIDVGTNNVVPHTDAHAFAFDNNLVYFASDGGAWRFHPAAPHTQALRNARMFRANNSPASVAAGKLSADANLDLAVANYYDSTVSVLIGGGDGTFSTPTAFTIGNGVVPNSVIIADVNNDGKADAITANIDGTNGNNVSVLLGNGAGGLGTPALFPTGPTPYNVVVGDFNNDGKPDLATSNYGNGTVSVLLGNGDGTFGAPITTGAGQVPTDLAAADFNGDGKTDLAVCGGNTGQVSILLGNGSGTFALYNVYAVGQGPSSITTADVTGDGKADVVVACRNSSTINVLSNNGSGAFVVSSYATGTNPTSVRTADLNGDGHPDIAAGGADGRVTVLLNNGTGAFLSSPAYYSTGPYPTWITAGDFNNDGKPDLATANYYGGTVGVLLNLSTTARGRSAWDDMNTSGLQTIQLQGLALHPTNPTILLEGSQDNGTARHASTTGPAWKTGSGGDGGRVRFDPLNGNYAYKVAPRGSFGPYSFFQRSSDAGLTWTDATGGIQGDDGFPGDGDDGPPMRDEYNAFPFYPIFNVDPANGSRLIIGSNVIYETRDRGDNWLPISRDAPNFLAGADAHLSAVQYAPSDDNTIYAGFDNGRMFVTHDDGANWLETSHRWGDALISEIAVLPDNANAAYLTVNSDDGSVGRVWMTVSGGAAWTDVTGNLPPRLAAQSVAVQRRGAKTNVYVGTDLGVYVNPDQGWTRYGAGLPNAQVLDLQLNTVTGLLGAGTHGRGVFTISVKPGDVNGDGVVGVADAVEALRIAGGLENAAFDQTLRADLAPDTGLTLLDAAAILRLAFGL